MILIERITMIRASIRALAFLIIIFVFSAQCANADYLPPDEKEVFWVLTNSWKIVDRPAVKVGQTSTDKMTSLGTESGYSINVTNGSKSLFLPVNIFLLAHNVNSDSICTGKYKAEMKDYLRSLKAFEKSEVLIKLTALKVNGPVQVSGIWPFNGENAWRKALGQGSQILSLSPAEVKKFGSAKAYKEELLKRTAQQWPKIESRKQ